LPDCTRPRAVVKNKFFASGRRLAAALDAISFVGGSSYSRPGFSPREERLPRITWI
jgi:hypothetical protein